MVLKPLRILALLLLMGVGAQAAETLSNPAQEARAAAIGEELRCVVCQSESINDSQADMARDMRLLVREKITQGWTDAQILSFAQKRYGDFILLKPPFQPNTYVLWGLPVGILSVAACVVALLFRKRKN